MVGAALTIPGAVLVQTSHVADDFKEEEGNFHVFV